MPTISVTVNLDTSATATELDTATGYLRQELQELKVGPVERAATGPAPDGARAVELLELGQLLVTIAETVSALGGVAATVRSWLSRRAQRGRGGTVRLEIDGDTIDITGASAEQQDVLIAAWLDRHT